MVFSHSFSISFVFICEKLWLKTIYPPLRAYNLPSRVFLPEIPKV